MTIPSKKLYSIYRFKDPRDQAVLYIGLTNNPKRRYREHISEHGLLYSIAQELAAEGLQLIFDILESGIQTKEQANAREKYWIQYHLEQGYRLKNTTYNLATISIEEEDTRFREKILKRFSYLPENKANLLAEMILKGVDLFDISPWQLNFNAVGLTLKYLIERGLLVHEMDEIDAAKITFNMFGYDWEDDDEVAE